MADIKTRDMVKGTIKTIDKAAVAADRMRVAFVQTKEKTEHSTHAQENSAEEYASDRIESGIDRASHEAAYQFDKQGRKGVEATKQNISKAKDGKGFCKGSSKSGTGGSKRKSTQYLMMCLK